MLTGSAQERDPLVLSVHGAYCPLNGLRGVKIDRAAGVPMVAAPHVAKTSTFSPCHPQTMLCCHLKNYIFKNFYLEYSFIEI